MANKNSTPKHPDRLIVQAGNPSLWTVWLANGRWVVAHDGQPEKFETSLTEMMKKGRVLRWQRGDVREQESNAVS